MTRAVERPTTVEPDKDKTGSEDDFWEQGVEGDTPDSATTQALNLAHRATEKFPELANRYKAYAGPAAIVSGALMALAGVAVARRLRRGQKPDEILAQITPEEIERAADVSIRENRVWRMVKRIALRRSAQASSATPSDE